MDFWFISADNNAQNAVIIVFSIDNLIEGGFHTGEVTEVIGSVAAGKTQVNILGPFKLYIV